MQSPPFNLYEDAERAQAYARLEFKDDYYLAFRDIPALIAKYVRGKKALDFGCGTGRTTRFLKSLRLETIGVDVSAEMLKIARKSDPSGDYREIEVTAQNPLGNETVDLVFCGFPFDNIPGFAKKAEIFTGLRKSLAPEGIIINLVSSVDIYIREWATFTTKDFPENRRAKCGDVVKIITKGIGDERPVEDILWPDEDYIKVYEAAGLSVLERIAPLAVGDEPYEWVDETKTAPWVIWTLINSVR